MPPPDESEIRAGAHTPVCWYRPRSLCCAVFVDHLAQVGPRVRFERVRGWGLRRSDRAHGTGQQFRPCRGRIEVPPRPPRAKSGQWLLRVASRGSATRHLCQEWSSWGTDSFWGSVLFWGTAHGTTGVPSAKSKRNLPISLVLAGMVDYAEDSSTVRA